MSFLAVHVRHLAALRLDLKFDVFVVFMATRTIEYNLKISLLFSLQKIRSLDFPINLHTAYYNLSLPFETYLTKF